MEQPVNNTLVEYIDIVHQYFSGARIDESFLSADQYNDQLCLKLREAWRQKDLEHNRWNQLLEAFRNLNWAYTPRDMSYDTNEGFKAIIRVKIPGQTNRLVGIIVHLSFIEKKIGFYYSDTLTKNNWPIAVSLKHSVSHLHPERTSKDASYYPLNEYHIEYKTELISIMRKIFPEFSEFNNEYADYKVDWIQTENGYYHNLDLFQVFFGTNIHGVI